MKIDQLFAGLNISATGLRAQRQKMNAISENIANADTTRTEQGGPYRRKVVTFHEDMKQAMGAGMQSPAIALSRTSADHMQDQGMSVGTGEPDQGGVAGKEELDPTAFKMIHDPGHPDADENGYVRMPNVNIVTEMVDMVNATRSFEANVTAINAAKTMSKDSLEI